MNQATRTGDTKLRLLVVDDQPIIRRGLALMLAAEADIDLVGQAADGAEALGLCERLHPHVVLMDLRMPRMSGVVATRQLAERQPDIGVVVLTTFDDDELVFEAVRAGARAYLLKDASEHEVLDTVRAVRHGESRLSPAVARKVLEQFRAMASGRTPPAGPAAPPHDPMTAGAEPLTEKEGRVLALIAEGLSNRQIAERVFLAEGTVKNHVSRIMEKLQAHNRTELALKASRRSG